MVFIKTTVKIRCNQPDLVIWEVQKKICHIIEFKCRADINVTKNALDTLPNDMHESIRQLGFNQEESHDIIRAIQTGTVKAYKTLLNFKK